MLEIVLFILKTAGIILVSVLGILIVLTGVVLFVPVRYRGDISVFDAEDDGKKVISVRLGITWFLRLVRVHASCEERIRVQMKALFFTLMDTDKEQSKNRGRKEKRKKDRGKDGAERKEQSVSTAGEAVAGKADERKEIPCGDDGREEAAEAEGEKSEAGGKKSMDSRISNILQTIRNFCDKLKGIKKKAEKIEGLWVSEHAVNSRNLLGKQLLYLLKHTKPKKLSGYLRFGFDDPSLTGYAMAVYGLLYPVWNPKLNLEPDFEKQVLDCHLLMKGKIRVWHLVRAALRMLLSRDVRRVIKDVREF